MQTHFRVWLRHGSEVRIPDWQSLGAVDAKSIAAGGWDVTVEGDGEELQKKLESHPSISLVQRIDAHCS